MASIRFHRLRSASEVRPELEAALTVLRGASESAQAEAFHHLLSDDTTGMVPGILCNWTKEKGNALFTAGRYTEALSKYLEAMRAIVGPATDLPSSQYLNPTYLSFSGESDWRAHLDLVACANNVAQSHLKLNNIIEALDWLQEVEVLYICQRLAQKPDDLRESRLFIHSPWKPRLLSTAWIDWHIEILEHFTYRIKTAIRFCDIFNKLGNTASAWYFAQKSFGYSGSCPPGTPQIEALQKQCDIKKMALWKHPEPSLIDKWDVTHPGLQIRGAWQKVTSIPGTRPPNRHGFASWIWRSKLYVAGGQSAAMQVLSDLWCIDLIKTASWRRLLDYPAGFPRGKAFMDQRMKVWDNKAWLFTGSKRVWIFDLIKEEWKQLSTTFHGKRWLYQRDSVVEHCVEIFEGKLYVFGGDDGNTSLGTNLFMVLDLKTLQWQHLGGTSEAKTTTDMPMLRRHASSWVVPEQRRLYILFGNACRLAAHIQQKPHGNEQDYNCEDMWSYSIQGRMWSRERFRGNFPSPRTEMACAFHPTFSRVIIYGGYNASVTTVVLGDVANSFAFAFYGDTFLMDPTTRSWTHILTRGFPSYRAQSHIIVDEATGKTYLYGGYTNSEFVPSKHALQRSFGDIWQLALDLPGEDFNEVDFVKSARSLKVGPWMRCFSCGNVGTTWRKCAGTCGGKLFFCSTDCQREGWQEHKKTHGCRKQ